MFSGNSCTKNTTHQPNWSELPPELLELVMKSLNAVDIIHIKPVCTSWMHAVKHYSLPQSPWLMLPSNDQNNVTSRRFFDVAGKPAGASLRLPEIGTAAEISTSFNMDVHVLHYLCRRSISKVVLSSDPARNNNFTAAAVFNEKQKSGLAYCKKGTVSFRVYKVNVTKSKLEKVECLDDQVESVLLRTQGILEFHLPGITHGNEDLVVATIGEERGAFLTPTHSPALNSDKVGRNLLIELEAWFGNFVTRFDAKDFLSVTIDNVAKLSSEW
ncbi:hypothetical protein ACLB2K_036789 [Fragaria x ananassa]